MMLLQTRYPARQYRGLDGAEIEFSVFVRGLGNIYGRIWSPSAGLPKEITDIGFALANYCNAPEAERPDRRGKLVVWLNDFAQRKASEEQNGSGHGETNRTVSNQN